MICAPGRAPSLAGAGAARPGTATASSARLAPGSLTQRLVLARPVICAARRTSKADGAGQDAAAGGSSPVAAPPPRRRAAAPSSAPAPAAPAPPSPYAEALLQREYELWQRQTELLERAQEAHDRDLERWDAERAGWQAQEAALRQEAAELRAQLLYVLAQLNALQAGAGVGGAMPPPSGSSVGSSRATAIAGREPAAALSSGAADVKAAMDALRPQPGAQAAAAATASTASSSSSNVEASAAWAADEGMPAFAADLAAAVAAVEESDVLAGVGTYVPPSQQSSAAASSSAAPPAPFSPPTEPEPEAAATEAPKGPPPALMMGADDIFWMSQLHTALTDMGYYPGDADIDDFYFGDGTESALMTMQACEGLPETGVTDDATWAKLLGPDLSLKPSRDLTADMLLNVPGLSKLGGGGAAAADDSAASSSSSSSSPASSSPAGGAAAYTELFSATFSETISPTADGGLRDVQRLTVEDTVSGGGARTSDRLEVEQQVRTGGVGDSRVTSSIAAAASHHKTLTDWPILREGDGGREVHAMQVLLEKQGYYPSEDDMRWWSFGDGTLTALKTFQACSGYPESGVCDPATWRSLLGPEGQPSDILSIQSGNSDDDDLAFETTERVWLIGEQRWEDRSRMNKA